MRNKQGNYWLKTWQEEQEDNLTDDICYLKNICRIFAEVRRFQLVFKLEIIILGGCYLTRPYMQASSDNTLLNLDNSSDDTQPNSKIVKYCKYIFIQVIRIFFFYLFNFYFSWHACKVAFKLHTFDHVKYITQVCVYVD